MKSDANVPYFNQCLGGAVVVADPVRGVVRRSCSAAPVASDQSDHSSAISRAGQLEMKAQLLRCMRQVDRGVDGLPDRLRLLDPKNESVVAAEVDPEIRFGQPRIPGTGIPTAIIYERWRAGEAAAQLAAIYERPVVEVTSAISYEESSRAA